MKAVVVGGCSDVGRMRRRNEDHYLVQRWVDNSGSIELRLSAGSRQLAAGGLLCVVGDGLGGHAGGDEASWLALDTLWRSYFASPTGLGGGGEEIGAHLGQSVLAADAAVRRAAAADRKLRDMGSTAVGLVVEPGRVCGFNVGDSRLYHLHGGSLVQVSCDHTVAQDLVRSGQLTPEDAERVQERHILTNCLGGPAEIETYVDLHPLDAPQPGDRFLLCSDGVSGVIDPEELERICATVSDSPVAVAGRLITEANRRGGPDNATALVVEIE